MLPCESARQFVEVRAGLDEQRRVGVAQIVEALGAVTQPERAPPGDRWSRCASRATRPVASQTRIRVRPRPLPRRAVERLPLGRGRGVHAAASAAGSGRAGHRLAGSCGWPIEGGAFSLRLGVLAWPRRLPINASSGPDPSDLGRLTAHSILGFTRRNASTRGVPTVASYRAERLARPASVIG
jgi:hypothetical protein